MDGDSATGLLAWFAPCFTAPTFQTFTALACGFLAQTGPRTVTGMLLRPDRTSTAIRSAAAFQVRMVPSSFLRNQQRYCAPGLNSHRMTFVVRNDRKRKSGLPS